MLEIQVLGQHKHVVGLNRLIEFVMSANEEEFRMKYIFCYITKATFLKELYLKTNLIKKYNKLNETIEGLLKYLTLSKSRLREFNLNLHKTDYIIFFI
jgi:hypothetical protein